MHFISLCAVQAKNLNIFGEEKFLASSLYGYAENSRKCRGSREIVVNNAREKRAYRLKSPS